MASCLYLVIIIVRSEKNLPRLYRCWWCSDVHLDSVLLRLSFQSPTGLHTRGHHRNHNLRHITKDETCDWSWSSFCLSLRFWGMSHRHLPRSSLNSSSFPSSHVQIQHHIWNYLDSLSLFSAFFAVTIVPRFSLEHWHTLLILLSTSLVFSQTSKVVFQKWILIFVTPLLNFIQCLTIAMGRL